MNRFPILVAGLSVFLGAACGSESDDAATPDGGAPVGGTGGEAAGGEASGGGVVGGEAGGGEVGGAGGESGGAGGGEPLPTGNFPKDGLWAVTMDIVEFGLKLPLQFEIDGTETTRTLDSVTLRAANADYSMVSDPIATLTDIPVAADGSFSLPFENATLPGAYTPTGSDVVVTVTFAGAVTGDARMCGAVTGEVVTLEVPLNASTFGGVPADAPAEERIHSCESGMEETLTPIDPADCPALVEGENAGFPSAGLERTFRLFVPATWTAGTRYPLVFVWHGLGQSQDEIEENSNIEALVDEFEDKPGVEWDQLGVGENPDLVFFDDMITCIDKGYGVDPDRVHSTGLSAGGLWTTYLTMFRSETIASSVAFSGGLLVDYPAPEAKRPMIAAWGGPEDTAFDQNFDVLANDLISEIVPAGHFVLACDHGQGHKWLPEFSPWALQFLLDHPRTLAEEPYAAGLPAGVFPEYCTIATVE
jgi:predicted esterase